MTFLKLQAQPTEAVGSVRTPVEAAQAVPMVMANATVPLLALIDGDEQNPELTLGAVALNASLLARL